MVVEFIGAAGVGKSFLSRRVIEELKSRGVRARGFNEIRFSRIRFRSVRLMLHAAYLGVLIWPRPLFRLRRAIVWLGAYCIRGDLCDELGCIGITSEGVFHRIVDLHRQSGRSTAELADLVLPKIRAPDVIVILEASAQTIFSRRAKRNRANDHFSYESVVRDIEIVREQLQTIDHVRHAFCPTLHVLRVSAEDDGGVEPTSEIVVFLQQIVGQFCSAARVPGAQSTDA